MQQRKRTLKRAIDLESLETISSDQLLAYERDEYQRIRRIATKSHKDGKPRYTCEKCGHGVYAPLDQNRKPLWQHFKNAPTNCPWGSNKNKTIDEVSAKQFQGRQESPLHKKIKEAVAEILEFDPCCEDIRIEETVFGEEGRRKPDVYCTYKGDKFAFEVQLAFTQIPIIMAREEFYKNEGINLVWLTWNFEEKPLDQINQSFIDIYYSHSQNIFSLNDDIIARSKTEKSLHFLVHALRVGVWERKTVNLGQLQYNEHNLPYFFKREPTWEEKIKERWIATFEQKQEWALRRKILEEVITRQMYQADVYKLEEEDFPELIDALCSFEAGYPTNSNQSNLTELANTFLSSKRRHRYAKVFAYCARKTRHKEVLEKTSVMKKLSEAIQAEQISRGQTQALLIRKLFPNWVDN